MGRVNGFFIQPEASSKRDLVLKPFSTALWVALFGTYGVLVLSRIILRYNQLSSSSYSLDVVWGVAALCQQGWHVTPTSLPSRVVFLFGYLTGLLSFVAFSASIVSLLALNLLPINSRRDLLTSHFTFHADSKSSTLAYVVQVQYQCAMNMKLP